MNYDNNFNAVFGPDAEKVAQEYTLEQAVIVQMRLNRFNLYLPNVMGSAFFVADTLSDKLYILDKDAESAVRAKGLKPENFFEYERIGALSHHSYKGGLVEIVTLEKERPIIPKFTTDPTRENLFSGCYRDNPFKHDGHLYEHAFTVLH